jgi:hypothetical protein
MRKHREPKPARPAPIVYDLAKLPQLNATGEQVRGDVERLVDYMGKAGRRPSHIHLRPAQHASLMRAVDKRVGDTAPPPQRADLRRHSADRPRHDERRAA